MACAISFSRGMLVRVGAAARIRISTMDPRGRMHERIKILRAGQFLFGTVLSVAQVQEEILETVLRNGKPVFDGRTGCYQTKVTQEAKYLVLVRWDGPKERTSTLPSEVLTPASTPVHPKQ